MELHRRVDPTTGRPVFGGPQPGSGRPRKPRVSERVLEKVQAEADKVAAAIVDNLGEDKPPSVRLQAARQALEVEQQEEARREAEERELDRMGEAALLGELARSLSSLVVSGNLDEALAVIGASRAADAESDVVEEEVNPFDVAVADAEVVG